MYVRILTQSTLTYFLIAESWTVGVHGDMTVMNKDEMAKLNQGYINSKIPVRAKLHCLQELQMNETMDATWHNHLNHLQLL